MTKSASSALAKLHKPHIKQLVFQSMTFKGVQRDFFPPTKQALTAETASSTVVHIVILQ